MTARLLGAVVAASLGLLAAPAAQATNVGFPVGWLLPTSCTGTDWRRCMGVDMGAYNLVFEDTFTINKIGADGTISTWYAATHPPFVSGETQAHAGDPWAYVVSGGLLTLSTRYDTVNGVSRYVEADLETDDSHGHLQAWRNFYAEVRMKGPVGVGVHAGVWFLSPDNGKTDSTGGHVELDLVEQYGLGDESDHSSSHIWPGRRTDITHIYASRGTRRPEGSVLPAWHTYGLLATDSLFVVSEDGVPVKTIQRQPMQRTPMYMLLSLMGNPAAGKPVAASMQVDYVRVWTPK